MKYLNSVFIVVILALSSQLQGQYVFKDIIRNDHTDVKSQDRTGTCWSYSTVSFIESELMRQGHGPIDLSEMYFVRNIYRDKAKNYVYRQGKANFSEGALAHDIIRALNMFGAVPESAYQSHKDAGKYNHSEMARVLKAALDAVLSGKPSQWWPAAIDGILDAYMGQAPTSFDIGGISYTPAAYRDHLGIATDDYITLTSFMHHPFYSSFVLEIPDNYSNGLYYNLPVNELMDVMIQALQAGYTIEWDGDVSEKGFGRREGIAIMPTSQNREDLFEQPGYEVNVSQSSRQEAFESFETTDDHLMHIVGLAEDQNGAKYFIVKNSWGASGPYNGIYYMSLAYMKMKTVGILLHKDALSKDLRTQLGI